MRLPTIARSSLVLASAVTLLATASLVRADEEFDVSVAGGHVTVKTKGKWHINKDYPWRFTSGETKLDKSRFTLSDEAASLDAPKGEGKLKGGVCNGDQCLRIEKTLVIP